MIILGIETSCDETSAAIVRDGVEVLSSVIHSQVEKHRPHGGVVPEIASRMHVETLPGLMLQALEQAGIGWDRIDAVAATRGPGLAGALLIGYSAAKALALRLGKPFRPVHHLEAHLYAVFLGPDAPGLSGSMPALGLLVSGGHSCLLHMKSPLDMRLLGQTIDDAAGEALDKGASLLGLGYPGGPVIERLARDGRADFVNFPRARIERLPVPGLAPELCFSFSGVKTALKYHLQRTGGGAGDSPADLAASYQEAIFDALATGFDRALARVNVRSAIAGGGVICNRSLRGKLEDVAARRGCALHLAAPVHCADNAAMIAGLAAHVPDLPLARLLDEDIHPRLPLGACA